jgi:hypothetical protein
MSLLRWEDLEGLGPIMRSVMENHLERIEETEDDAEGDEGWGTKVVEPDMPIGDSGMEKIMHWYNFINIPLSE